MVNIYNMISEGIKISQRCASVRGRCFTANLQIRAAIVLGVIGDSRALPVLTNLECQTGSVDCYYIQEAIRAILVRVSRGW
jgi:hypothetical protein